MSKAEELGEDREGSTARTEARAFTGPAVVDLECTVTFCTCEMISRGYRVVRSSCPVHGARK